MRISDWSSDVCSSDLVLARIIPTQDACQIDLLDWLEPGDVASIIEKEHPQVAALLIANLDPAVGAKVQIGRAHVCTPVTNAHLVCRLLLEKKPQHHNTTTQQPHHSQYAHDNHPQ